MAQLNDLESEMADEELLSAPAVPSSAPAVAAPSATVTMPSAPRGAVVAAPAGPVRRLPASGLPSRAGAHPHPRAATIMPQAMTEDDELAALEASMA